jgi:hypothetical protein
MQCFFAGLPACFFSADFPDCVVAFRFADMMKRAPIYVKFWSSLGSEFTALHCTVRSEPRQLIQLYQRQPPHQIKRGISANVTKMKVLVYGYAFPGSGRIRLNTVLLNPVSLLCLYLYPWSLIVTTSVRVVTVPAVISVLPAPGNSSSNYSRVLPPSENTPAICFFRRKKSGIMPKRHAYLMPCNEHYTLMYNS